MKDDLTKLEKVALAALQGLLASGHYTHIVDGAPKPKEFDIGPDWKEDKHPHRWRAHAASDAFTIARDFLKESEFWTDAPPKKKKA